jgi:hypothetical protein
MKKFLLSLGVFVLAFSGVSMFAQDGSGMTGTVTDVSGAVIPETVVVISNASTGVTFTQTTNSQGTYRFPNLPPQIGYVVTFTHTGFSSLKISDVELNVGVTRTQNASLVAGAIASVEVNAQATEVTLNTTDAAIGNNFNIELLDEMPVQNRNSPTALFTLQPGVVNSSVTGSRADQTSITVDGMDVNDISTGQFGTIVANMPVDAVQEFKGTVAGLPNSLGTGSGGQFQLVTKSGTNRFHGNANEYHRDTSTTSNLWFNNNGNIGRTPLIQNQFGGAVGGPILHNKLFFFADFYNSRIIQSITTTRTVPLDSYRAGNISYIKNTAGCATTSRQNTTPTCIGTFTPAQVKALDPAGIGEDPNIFALINSRYPHVNDVTLGDGVNQGIYRFTQPAPNIEYDGVARMDYNLTKHMQVFIQFHAAHRDSIQSQNRFGGDPVTRPFQDRSYGYVGSWIWQIGANKVNQFYYGDNVQVVSFPLTYNPLGTTVFNTFGGYTQPYDGGNIQRRRIPIPTVRDDFNWQIGRHTINIGGTFKFVKTSNLLVNDYNFYSMGLGGNTASLNAGLRPSDINTGTTPLSEFDNTFSLALGRISAVNSNYNYTASGAVLPQNTGGIRRYRYYQTEVYVGDVWKVNRQLTVNYGLRYQYDSVPYESAGAESVPSIGFDSYMQTRVTQSAAAKNGNASLPFITYNLGGKANNGPNFYDPNVKDFAPRFAFTYNPASFQTLVINGAAGLVYDRTIVNAINFIQNQASYLFQNSAVTNYGDPSSPSNSLKNDPRYGANFGFPTAPVAPAIGKPFTPFVSTAGVPTGLTGGNGNNAVDPHLHDPYNIQMNAGIQQEFPGRFVMKLSYVGRLGRRLLGQADASQLINYVDPVSGQSLGQAYAAVTTQLRAGVKATSVTPQPFFENVLTPGFGASKTCGTVSCGNNTDYHAFNSQSNITLGDITDSLRTIAQAGILPANVGLASQFANNTYYTNKGFSTYNGMLFTLSKNLSEGVKFDFNYTWSHSIDNVSVVANTVAGNTGFICDVLNMRACRGNSDFDTTHVITTDFIAQLPFGRGRLYANNVPWYVDEFIGGWDFSGDPRWQSGPVTTTLTSAFLAGFANQSPAIFNGNRGDIQAHIHKTSAGQLQMFTDPVKAQADFSGPVGIQYGSRNIFRLPSQFNMDVGLAKTFQILPNDRLKLVFRADFFNILNHATFTTLTNNITSGTFGVLTGQANIINNGTRVGQFALRLEF